MTIKTRMNKINQIADNTVTIFDNHGMRRAYQVVSTRTGKPFQVMVDWSKGSELIAKTELYVFDHKEQVTSTGNHRVDFCRSTVGYQALGALKFAAKQVGKVLSICENKVNAQRLLRFGGELLRITNLGGAVVWATIR